MKAYIVAVPPKLLRQILTLGVKKRKVFLNVALFHEVLNLLKVLLRTKSTQMYYRVLRKEILSAFGSSFTHFAASQHQHFPQKGRFFSSTLLY